MLCVLTVATVALAACGRVEDSPVTTSDGGVSSAGSSGAVSSSGGMSGAAGQGSGGSIQIHVPDHFPPPDEGCSGANGNASFDAPAALFCGHAVWNAVPARRELYSWTTAEQAAELRSDGVLFTRSERPGMGPGYAFAYMAQVAAAPSGVTGTLLEGVLKTFEKGRYAWPNPWATRLGWPGEDYGDQLLRIVLTPEAWLVVVTEGGGVSVVDMAGKAIPVSDAAAAIERIGAIYFIKKDVRGSGSFFECSGGYREFIVGNLDMIEEWSLGTETIRSRIEADAALIESFRLGLEPPDLEIDAAAFNVLVACNWDAPVETNVDRYERALAIPSANYIPTQTALTNLRDTLLASLFEVDPLVVKPGQ